MSEPEIFNKSIIVTADPKDGVGPYRPIDKFHPQATHVPISWMEAAQAECRRLNAELDKLREGE